MQLETGANDCVNSTIKIKKYTISSLYNKKNKESKFKREFHSYKISSHLVLTNSNNTKSKQKDFVNCTIKISSPMLLYKTTAIVQCQDNTNEMWTIGKKTTTQSPLFPYRIVSSNFTITVNCLSRSEIIGCSQTAQNQLPRGFFRVASAMQVHPCQAGIILNPRNFIVIGVTWNLA